MEFDVHRKYRLSIYGAIGDRSYFEGTSLGTIGPELIPPSGNALENHINIFSALPEEVRVKYEDDYRSYNYLALKDDDGAVFYIGLPWIIENTSAAITNQVLVLEIGEYNFDNPNEFDKIIESKGCTVRSAKIITVE